MKKIPLFAFAFSVAFSCFAQNENNLVPNPSFEQVEGKLKGEGEIYLAAPWKSVTMNPVDLYSASAKNDQFSVPENKYGKEKANTGENYAGVSFYGYRGKLPRTYLGTELTKPLEAGKQYCLKYYVSLSDMSKYAVNNLAMYISKEEITEQNEANLTMEPQMMSITNDVFDQQFLWTPICGTYTAEGGEKFIAIGNFAADADTEQETIRLSREFSGRQEYNAYYFVDDVSVIDTEKIGEKDCACDKIAGGAMKVEYKTFGTDASKAAEAQTTYIVNSNGTKATESIEAQKEEAKKEETQYKTFTSEAVAEEEEEEEEVYSPEKVVVYFDAKLFKAKEAEMEKIETLATFLKANPKVKIQIEGHADPSESEVKALGKRRGFMLEKQLRDLGVPETQIKYVGVETEKPASKTDAKMNQRVTFSIQ